MSNSKLISFTQISPNRTSPRNHEIDTVTVHCYVGQVSVEDMAGWLCNPAAEASANYGIGSDGRIGLFVDEGDRSWCSSNKANDHRAITIECASDKTHPYAINDKVYASLINLLVDICQRNGIDSLRWQADKSLIGQVDKQNMTVHRWFAAKACPGDYLYSRHGQIAAEVNAQLSGADAGTGDKWYHVRKSWDDADSQLGAYEILENAKNNCPGGYSVFDENGKVVYTAPKTEGTQASEFANLTESQAAAKILEMARQDYKKTGVLASLTAAQMILESGYVKTELAKKANNCFGMKTMLSGNSWSGSTWDGKSKVNIRTAEEYTAGNITYIYADFRKYPCIEDSIGDHSAYLLGAKNGSSLRYGALVGCKDYKQAATIVKSGGYATDSQYVNKLCNIIERFGLNKYDYNTDVEENKEPVSEPSTPVQTISYYRVGTGWKNGKCQNQIGAYEIKDNAIKAAASSKDTNKQTYYVFDDNGKTVYTAKYEAPVGSLQYKVQCGSFTVKANAEKLQKQIKSKGFDAIIKQEGNQYKVQCGSFSIKANAEKLRDQLKAKGFDVIIKEYGEDTDNGSGADNFIAISKDLANIMISEKWTYSNSNNKMNFDDARKASNPVSNCALFASHCLQKAGYLNKNQTFYFKESGAVVSRQKGWERLQETCKVTVYKGVSLSKVDLRAGDVVCYNGHVNTFLGYENGKKTWLDAGRGGTKDVKAGSPFTKNMYKIGDMSGYKVYAVVRPL